MVESGWRKHFAAVLGLSRSSLYTKSHKQAIRDRSDVLKLIAIHEANPYYGAARFAMALGWNKKKARRIRDLAGIKAARRTKRRHRSLPP